MHFNLLFDLLVLVVFALMITVLVFMHELGHYLVARWFGMGVEEFAIGMGTPKLGTYATRKYRIPLTSEQANEYEQGGLRPTDPEGIIAMEGKAEEEAVLVRNPDGDYLEETTRFTFRAWPVGGFVRIKGMMPETQGAEVRVPGGFYSRPPLQRLAVLFAGPLFSVLTGLVILVPFLMVVGKSVPNSVPIVGGVSVGNPADKAGIKAGDTIVSIDGQPVNNFYQIIEKVTSSEDKPLHFVIQRDGKNVDVTATPKYLGDGDSVVLGPDLLPTSVTKKQAKLGMSPEFKHQRVGLGSACVVALEQPFDVASGFLSSLIHPAKLKDQVGGPIAIVSATAEATKGGVEDVISMAAMLSISLGIINLLPIVPLDGGQMVVAFLELLRKGRRISFRTQNAVAAAGLATLALIVVSVLVLDVQRLRANGSAVPDEKVERKAPTPSK